MGKKKRKKLIHLGSVLILFISILTGIIYINRKLVAIIARNIFAGTISLDTSEIWENGNSYEGVQYAEISNSQYLNLYVPYEKEPMPLFILVHGGGFIYNDCESRQAQFMYRYFRDQGYACASVNYRLSDEAGYPAAIEDVKAAVRYLRANAEKYGYDGESFAIWGESAGGYLATMAAVTYEEYSSLPFMGENLLNKPISGKVSALVNFYGVIDFNLITQDFKAANIPGWLRTLAYIPFRKDLRGYKSIEDMWLRKPISQLTEEESKSLSPRYYINKNMSEETDLKVLIHHGDADITVPYIQSERLADSLTYKLGAENVTYKLISGYKHGDDKFYTKEELGKIKVYLDQVFY